MRSNADVTRVAIGNPKTADVSVVNRRDLLLNGKALGITSLIVWVKGSNTPRQYIVRVQLRSEEHTSELQSLMRISYAVFCLKKKKHNMLTENTKSNRYTARYIRQQT